MIIKGSQKKEYLGKKKLSRIISIQFLFGAYQNKNLWHTFHNGNFIKFKIQPRWGTKLYVDIDIIINK